MTLPFGRTRARDRGRGKGGGGPTLAVFDFTSSSIGALSFSRASSGTAQTGTSTVNVSGFGVDTPRFGRALDADSIGLVIEPARTNLVTFGRALSSMPSAGSGYTSTTGQTGPDGAANAERAQVSSGGFSKYSTASVTGSYTGSIWYAKGSGSGSYSYAFSTAHGASGFMSGTAGAAWARVANTLSFAAQSYFALPFDGQGETGVGGPAAAARDALADLHQVELGKWASEYVHTSGATATRAGERLYLSAGSSVVSGGRLSLHLRMQLKHTPGNSDTAFRLWTDHSDATTYVEIATTGVMTVSVAGSTNTTNALSWVAGDIVDIFVAAGGGAATVVKYRTNGGAATTCTITGSALGTIAPSGAIDLLCDASTAKQPGARVYGLTFYRSGQAPAWAA